jgi:hypothetical protein
MGVKGLKYATFSVYQLSRVVEEVYCFLVRSDIKTRHVTRSLGVITFSLYKL